MTVPTSHAPTSALAIDDATSRRVLEGAHAGLMLLRHDRVLYVNAMMVQLFGWSAAELAAPGFDPYGLVAPDERDGVRANGHARGQALQQDGGVGFELRCLRRDGTVFDARAWISELALADGPAQLVTVQDSSELSRAARGLQRRARMQAQAERLAALGSAETDLDSGRTALSEGLCRLFGEPPVAQAVDEDWLLARVPADEQPLVRLMRDSVTPGDPCELRHHIRHVDGTLRLVTHRRAIEPGQNGEPARAFTLLRDVTEEDQAASRLHRLAHVDEVTSMPNRRALRQWLDDAMHSAGPERAGGGEASHADARRFALLVLDVAQVGVVADTLGEAAADALRQQLADRLSARVRARDTVAAIGAGMFAVLLQRRAEDFGEEEASRVARMLLDGLAAPASVDGHEIALTPAVGLAMYPADGREADLLLQHAQAALRDAQGQGPGRMAWYRAEANARAAERLAMEAALRRALEREEFSLAYQPQVALASGRMVGVEALLRWQDPQRGAIPPAQFIPLAESTGQILAIGDWVLQQAITQAAHWARAGHALRVAVNLSALQLQQSDLADRVQAWLLAQALSPSLLGLEVTESMLVDPEGPAVTTLRQLRSIGVEISLDDFGTGYSNLGRLRHLPIDIVKIDRSLVHDVTAQPEDVSITRAVIALAHSLQLRVLAEGVETEGQLALLAAQGCDQLQGYWYSRAVPPQAIDALLATPRPLATPMGLSIGSTDRHERTVLLVDDEANVLAALRRLLRRSNCRILTASSGAEGLQRLAAERVDLIVSDQRMPGMTGVEFLRRAKVLHPETVRIVLSGYTELQSVTDAINEGAIYKFLTKPWDDVVFVKLVEDAFQQKAMADENRRLSQAVALANTELAAVNERLQVALSAQHEQMQREETLLGVARDMLESLPVPVLGLDADATIVFVNGEAEALFPAGTALLGSAAAAVLPAELRPLWQAGGPEDAGAGGAAGGGAGGRDGTAAAPCAVGFGAGPYWASCRAVTSAHGERGRLLVLVPRPPLAQAA